MLIRTKLLHYVLSGFAIAVLFQTGCGYTPAEPYPEQVSTVSVPIFENRTFYRGVEFQLTEAIIKQIHLRTPYKVVPSDRADSELIGTIVAIDQDRISRRRQGGVPEQVQLRLTVDMRWRDLQSGDILADRAGLSAIGRYVPSQPASETHTIGSREAIDQLATAIVSNMRGEW